MADTKHLSMPLQYLDVHEKLGFAIVKNDEHAEIVIHRDAQDRPNRCVNGA